MRSGPATLVFIGDRLTPRAAFLKTILEEPNDDSHRLVYADWLEENDQIAEAEFLREKLSVGVAYSSRHLPDQLRKGAVYREIERLLFQYRNYKLPPCTRVVVQHGFLQEVEMEWDLWAMHGNDMLASNPVTNVTLTTMPEIRFFAGGPDGRRAACLESSGAQARTHSDRHWYQLRPVDVGDLSFTESAPGWSEDGIDPRPWIKALLEIYWPQVIFELPMPGVISIEGLSS